VVAVKTTAIKAWRESEVPSGAKSDPGDADVIADYPSRSPPPAADLAPVLRCHQGAAHRGMRPRRPR
jgi:hypothetical protein